MNTADNVSSSAADEDVAVVAAHAHGGPRRAVAGRAVELSGLPLGTRVALVGSNGFDGTPIHLVVLSPREVRDRAGISMSDPLPLLRPSHSRMTTGWVADPPQSHE